MRFEKGHKEQTRQKIVETAARRFRQDGVAAVGIAGLMADAGLTHGGFYAHFTSKEALVREAVEAALAQTQESRARAVAKLPPGMGALERLVRFYLRAAHRDAPGQGCAAAALIAEIARHEPETRAAFSGRLRALLTEVAAVLPEDKTADEKERLAMGIFSVMLGTLQMARAVSDEALSDKMLESGIAAALALAAS